MATNWEFYVAIILGLIAAAIVGVFIFLLLNPPRDTFDTIRRPSAKPPKGPVARGPPKGQPRGPPRSSPRGPPRGPPKRK